jgi:hypothetical protein
VLAVAIVDCAAMQAIGYVELGDFDLAASNFNRSFANQQPPFMVWTETPSGGTPNFITGAGTPVLLRRIWMCARFDVHL